MGKVLSRRWIITSLLVTAGLLFTWTALRTALAQPTPPHRVFIPLVVGGGDSTGSSDAERIFPSGMAAASPLNLYSSTGGIGNITLSSSAFVPAYRVIAERIRTALLSTSTVAITDSVRSLVSPGGGRAFCYGPLLDYTNHPGGGSGELPGGDLGLWLEYEPLEHSNPNSLPTITQTIGLGTTDAYTLTYRSPGHACAAAQLNSLMGGVEAQSEAALTLAAALVSQAFSSGITIPTDGSAVDLTAAMNADYAFAFSSATISRTTDRIDYTLALTTTEQQVMGSGPSSHVYTVTVNLAHEPDSSDPLNIYEGLLTFQVIDNDYRGGLQCGGTPPLVAAISGSLAYNRLSATELRLQARQASFCAANAATAFDAQGLKLTNWSDDYNLFTANFDPTATFTGTASVSDTLTSNLAGSYTFAWQAGSGDSHTRVFNVGINNSGPVEGEAYFGFGRRIQEATGHSYPITSTTGITQTLTPGDGVLAVESMICNWAGPGSNPASREQPYAQRQFLRLNETTGFFEVPTGGSDIRYAPTNDCLYTATGYNNSADFWYDRNLNEVRDELYTDPIADDNPFGDRGVASISGISGDSNGAFDLMDRLQGGVDYGSIVNLIISGRNFRLPHAP